MARRYLEETVGGQVVRIEVLLAVGQDKAPEGDGLLGDVVALHLYLAVAQEVPKDAGVGLFPNLL